MKPHPRPPIIRKTIKWGGAVVTVLLISIVVWTGWGSRPIGRGACLAWGGLQFGYVSDPTALRFSEMPLHSRIGSWYMVWLPDWNAWPDGSWSVGLPLWPVIALSLVATTAAWRLDALARRRARIGMCPKCNYNRTGLAIGAKCPECGTATTSS